MGIHKSLVVVLLLLSGLWAKSARERFFDSQYSQVSLGRGLHIGGTTVQYGGMLASLALLAEDETSHYELVTPFIFTVGASTKLSAGVISGRAASRAVDNFNDIYGTKRKYIWDYYIVGCGALAFSFASHAFINQNDNDVDDSLLPIFALISSEIFLSIHSIKALRTTREMADYVDEHEGRGVAMGISPIFTKRGGAGVAFAIQF